MHPYTQYQLVNTRVAEMRSQAEHSRIVREARRAGRTQQRDAVRRIPGPSAMLHHLRSALLTSYGQRLRPGTAAPQLPAVPRT
jgi:hypothetical protein